MSPGPQGGEVVPTIFKSVAVISPRRSCKLRRSAVAGHMLTHVSKSHEKLKNRKRAWLFSAAARNSHKIHLCDRQRGHALNLFTEGVIRWWEVYRILRAEWGPNKPRMSWAVTCVVPEIPAFGVQRVGGRGARDPHEENFQSCERGEQSDHACGSTMRYTAPPGSSSVGWTAELFVTCSGDKYLLGL